MKNIMNGKNFLGYFNKLVIKNIDEYNKRELKYINAEYADNIDMESDNPLKDTYASIKFVFNNINDPHYNETGSRKTDKFFIDMYKKYYN